MYTATIKQANGEEGTLKHKNLVNLLNKIKNYENEHKQEITLILITKKPQKP